MLVYACERRAGGGAQDDRVLELDSDTVELDGDVELVDVRLGGGTRGDLEPASVRARSGDVVRFTAADALGHAVIFDQAALPAASVAFLERTNQLRGPPLIAKNARWVVSLEGAPSGTYTFVCLNHDARGTLVVAPGAASESTTR